MLIASGGLMLGVAGAVGCANQKLAAATLDQTPTPGAANKPPPLAPARPDRPDRPTDRHPHPTAHPRPHPTPTATDGPRPAPSRSTT